uniref:Uncharacterized protein n=2 Tax=Oryza meridionalis TaxID=40149 RepID=A0A0E0EM61_9ORYZ
MRTVFCRMAKQEETYVECARCEERFPTWRAKNEHRCGNIRVKARAEKKAKLAKVGQQFKPGQHAITE